MSSCDDNDDETAVTTHYGVSITLSNQVLQLPLDNFLFRLFLLTPALSQWCCNPDFQNESEETGAEANPIVVDDEDPFVTVESRVFVRWLFPYIISDSFWSEADY